MRFIRLLSLAAGTMLVTSCSIFLPEGREVSRLRDQAGDLQKHLDTKNEELAKAREHRARLEEQIKTAKRQISDTNKRINHITKTRKTTPPASATQNDLDQELISLQSLKAKKEEELRKAELELQFTY